MIKLKPIVEKSFQDMYHSKNKWIQLRNRGEKRELQDNLYVLIGNSYGPIGGHPRIPNISAILNSELTYWEAIDDDKDPDADAVLFGRRTKHGIKIIGMGHDGSSVAKSDLIRKMVAQLGKAGYYLEASGAVLHILYKGGTPYVTDPKKIKQMYPDRNVKWLNNKGTYTRKHSVASSTVPKAMFGKPR